MPPMNQKDLNHLRTAIALASDAKARGKHPFGALVVSADGEVLAQAGNASGWPDGDATRHAELVAVAEASHRAQQVFEISWIGFVGADVFRRADGVEFDA